MVNQDRSKGFTNRGRGGWFHGWGKFNAAQTTNVSNSSNQTDSQQFAAQNNVNSGQRPSGQVKCWRCGGWGHWSKECPSPYKAGNRGGGRGRTTRGRRGGRGRGRRGGNAGGGSGQPSNVNAALQVSDAGALGPSVQSGPGAAPVPSREQGN